MILLTGDVHGATDIHKLTSRRMDHSGLTRDDYLIILGDFGLIWEEPPAREDTFWLNWLEDAPWTTLFILGNHENYHLIRKTAPENWCGGRVRRFREHVLQLVDNEIFNIGGHTFFVRGGAHSSDRQFRTEGKSWWPEEVPTEEERAAAFAKLRSADWRVDYVLTHDGPADALFHLYPTGSSFMFTDEYARWLQKIANMLEFKRWFFGHHHKDRPHLGKYSALYHMVVGLDLQERQAPDTLRPAYG